MIRIPAHPGGKRILRVGAGDRPPPLRGHRRIVGETYLRAPGWQACDGRGIPDVYSRSLGVGIARAVRATIGTAHVDIHARMPKQDGCGAVPPDPRSSHLCGNLPCAPQRALRGVCARDTDRCALPRFVHSRGQEDATAHARRTPGPHARPNGMRRGSGVGEPRENQGECRAIPAPASAANSPREHDCEPAQEDHRSRSESDQHPRSACGRTQPPPHESNHDEHGEQGSSPQER